MNEHLNSKIISIDRTNQKFKTRFIFNSNRTENGAKQNGGGGIIQNIFLKNFKKYIKNIKIW